MTADTIANRVLLIAPYTPVWEHVAMALAATATTCQWLPPTTPMSKVVPELRAASTVLLVDLEDDPACGMEIVTTCRQAVPAAPVVVVAANPSMDLARSIRRAGVFYLALAPVTSEEIQGVLANAFDCLGRKRPDTSTCLAQPRILVVDDDADFAASIRTLLESRGYSVAVARSGKDGLEKLRLDPPDLIVLDVMMEYDSSGYEVTQAVRFGTAFEALRHIPILMVSSIAADPASRFSMAGEVEMVTPSRYMTKPVDVPAFLENVRTLLGEKFEPVTA